MNFRLARVLIGAPLLSSILLLSPASAQAPPAARACAPSQLEYLVMASLADSSNLLALSTYRASNAGLH